MAGFAGFGKVRIRVGYPRSAAEVGRSDHLCALRGTVVLATPMPSRYGNRNFN